MKWIGISKNGTAIFRVTAQDPKEAKVKGREMLEDPTYRPLLKLWIKDGSQIRNGE